MEVSQGTKHITLEGQDSRSALNFRTGTVEWESRAGWLGTCFEHLLINFLDVRTTCFI